MSIGATYIKAETVTKRKNLTGDGESEEKFPWTWQMGRQKFAIFDVECISGHIS